MSAHKHELICKEHSTGKQQGTCRAGLDQLCIAAFPAARHMQSWLGSVAHCRISMTTLCLCPVVFFPCSEAGEEGSASKKPRVIWSVEMHQQFVNVSALVLRERPRTLNRLVCGGAPICGRESPSIVDTNAALQFTGAQGLQSKCLTATRCACMEAWLHTNV
eukprot:1158402-Pelagomonas_calceolata.AAC.13